MKKIILTLILGSVLSGAYSQMTITGSDLPQAGMAFALGYDTTTPFDTATTGSAMEWNFSALGNSYTKFAVYSSTTPYHPYKNDFQDANMYTYGPAYLFGGFYGGAPVDENQWGYLYWSSTNDGFKIIGFRSDYGIGDRNVLEEPSELLMGTPATLNDTFSNNARWVVSHAENSFDFDTSYVSTVQKTLTVDAFGTIITPYDTFEVVRVHEYFIGIDTLEISLSGPSPYNSAGLIKADTLHRYYFWAKDVGYPVATVYLNKDMSIEKTEYISYKADCYAIKGTVNLNDGTTPLSQGNISLMAKDSWSHMFGVEEFIPIDANGNFQFSYVVGGNWVIRAIPQDQALYPTYYGNVPTWENATVLVPVSDTMITIDLWANPSQPIFTGSGSISGIIWQDTTQTKDFSNAKKSPNIEVILQDNSGTPLAYGYSDAQGNYTFSNLNEDTYKLKVEVPGLSMDSTYTIQITGTETAFAQKDFFYDSVSVQVLESTGVIENALNLNSLKIWPNPVGEVIFIDISNNNDGLESTISVFDITGKEVIRRYSDNEETISLDLSKIDKGLYMIRIDNTDGIYSGKFIRK